MCAAPDACGDGDEAAFGQLFERRHQGLRHVAPAKLAVVAAGVRIAPSKMPSPNWPASPVAAKLSR